MPSVYLETEDDGVSIRLAALDGPADRIAAIVGELAATGPVVVAAPIGAQIGAVSRTDFADAEIDGLHDVLRHAVAEYATDDDFEQSAHGVTVLDPVEFTRLVVRCDDEATSLSFPLRPAEFHLQGQHDQDTHGNRGPGVGRGGSATLLGRRGMEEVTGIESPRQVTRTKGDDADVYRITGDGGSITVTDRARSEAFGPQHIANAGNSILDARSLVGDTDQVDVVVHADYHPELPRVTAYVDGESPNVVNIVAADDSTARRYWNSDIRHGMMPSGNNPDVPIERYIAAHEYAHTRLYRGLDSPADVVAAYPLTPGSQFSELSRHKSPNSVDPWETHAEMFAEFATAPAIEPPRFLADGPGARPQPPSVSPLALAYAEKFGWKK